jgi:hypothetical protein
MQQGNISAIIAAKTLSLVSEIVIGAVIAPRRKPMVRLTENEIKAKEEASKPIEAVQPQQPQVLIIDPSLTNIMRLLMEVDAKLQYLIAGLTEKK